MKQQIDGKLKNAEQGLSSKNLEQLFELSNGMKLMVEPFMTDDRENNFDPA
jgi:hypothetical protein